LTNKRKDPNYEQITGLVPKEISRRFKQLLAVEGLKISDGVTEAIKFYLKEHEPKLSAALNPLPETIAELVQQNFYQLLTDGKITTDKLKVIASGSKPNASDLSGENFSGNSSRLRSPTKNPDRYTARAFCCKA
jgi:hypothetical protein